MTKPSERIKEIAMGIKNLGRGTEFSDAVFAAILQHLDEQAEKEEENHKCDIGCDITKWLV